MRTGSTQVHHENGVHAVQRRDREVVQAVVQHAHGIDRDHLAGLDERSAAHPRGLEVGNELTHDELELLALEVAVASTREHDAALALAIRDEHLGNRQLEDRLVTRQALNLAHELPGPPKRLGDGLVDLVVECPFALLLAEALAHQALLLEQCTA